MSLRIIGELAGRVLNSPGYNRNGSWNTCTACDDELIHYEGRTYCAGCHNYPEDCEC